jgi:Spy/CpxP family protein refolding chaperone
MMWNRRTLLGAAAVTSASVALKANAQTAPAREGAADLAGGRAGPDGDAVGAGGHPGAGRAEGAAVGRVLPDLA